MLTNLLLSGGSEEKIAVEDVFSCYLYTGNGSTQTITNGIDLSGKGGLVWIKGRSGATEHAIYDTARGVPKDLVTNTTAAETTKSTGLTGFSSTGFTVGALAKLNTNAATYASWTFRKAPKFFDVVTWTGDGAGTRDIAHSLGVAPGMIIVKNTGNTSNWNVWHRGRDNNILFLEQTAAASASTGYYFGDSSTQTASHFRIFSNGAVNYIGNTYVAYLFAHDTTADGVIQCGSVSNATAVNLGWEPQWLLIKRTNGTESWFIINNMTGWTASGIYNNLQPNTSNAESVNSTGVSLNSSGFKLDFNTANNSYIYVAIRRGPMRTPTDATKVFQPVVYTGTNVDNRLVNTTIAPDMVWVRQRNDTALGGMVVGDRMRAQPYLLTGTTAAEVTTANAFDAQLSLGAEYGTAFSAMNGFWCGNDATAKLNANTTASNHIAEAFKRAPGFFDISAYTGDGVAGRTVAHNLGVAPEIIIVKIRSGATGNWRVYAKPLGATNFLTLSATTGSSASSIYWNNTEPTSTQFTVGTSNNGSGFLFISYLFATCPGVSKVGSYTGTGTTQQINCGFTNGARFVLIKRTDSTGDWTVWDSARGIVSGSDPYLLLNSTAAEVTNTDYIDPYSAGFEISSTAPAAINANGGTYIFLAIS